MNLKTNGEYLFDCLVGTTPIDNKLAIRFAEKMGFTIVGFVPTFGILSYLERKKDGQIC